MSGAIDISIALAAVNSADARSVARRGGRRPRAIAWSPAAAAADDDRSRSCGGYLRARDSGEAGACSRVVGRGAAERAGRSSRHDHGVRSRRGLARRDRRGPSRVAADGIGGTIDPSPRGSLVIARCTSFATPYLPPVGPARGRDRRRQRTYAARRPSLASHDRARGSGVRVQPAIRAGGALRITVRVTHTRSHVLGLFAAAFPARVSSARAALRTSTGGRSSRPLAPTVPAIAFARACERGARPARRPHGAGVAARGVVLLLLGGGRGRRTVAWVTGLSCRS